MPLRASQSNSLIDLTLQLVQRHIPRAQLDKISGSAIALPLDSWENTTIELGQRTFKGKTGREVTFLTAYGKGATGEIPFGGGEELNAARDPVESAHQMANRIVRAYFTGEGQHARTADEFATRFTQAVAPLPSVSAFDEGDSFTRAAIAYSRPAINNGLTQTEFGRQLATFAVAKTPSLVGLHVGVGEQNYGQYRMTQPIAPIMREADLPAGWDYQGGYTDITVKAGKERQYEGETGQFKLIKDMKRELLRQRLDVPGMSTYRDPLTGQDVRYAMGRFAEAGEPVGMGGTVGSSSFLSLKAITQPRERRFSFSAEMPLDKFQPGDRTVFGANESINLGTVGDRRASIDVPGFYGSEIHGSPTLYVGFDKETGRQVGRLTGMSEDLMDAAFTRPTTTDAQVRIRAQAMEQLRALPQFTGMNVVDSPGRGIELGVNVSHQMPAYGLKDTTKLVPAYMPGVSERMTRQGLDLVVPYSDVKRPTFAEQVGRGLVGLYGSTQMLEATRAHSAPAGTDEEFAQWNKNVYEPQMARWNALPEPTRQAAEAAYNAYKNTKNGTYFDAFQAAAPYLKEKGAFFPIAFDAGDVAALEYKGNRSMTLPELTSLAGSPELVSSIIGASTAANPKGSILQSLVGSGGRTLNGPVVRMEDQPIQAAGEQLAAQGIGPYEALNVGGQTLPGYQAASEFRGGLGRMWLNAVTAEGDQATAAASAFRSKLWESQSESEEFRKSIAKVETQAGSFERYSMFMPGGNNPSQSNLMIGSQQAELYAKQMGISMEEFTRASQAGEVLASSKRYPINDANASLFKVIYDPAHKGAMQVSALTTLTEFGDADLDPRSVNILGQGVDGKYQSLPGSQELFAKQPRAIHRAFASVASVIGEQGITNYQAEFQSAIGRAPMPMEMLTGVKNGEGWFNGIDVSIPGIGNQNLIGEMYADNFKTGGGLAIDALMNRTTARVTNQKMALSQMTTAEIKNRMSIYNLTQGLGAGMQKNKAAMAALPQDARVSALMPGYTKADTAQLSMRNLYQQALDAGNLGPQTTKLMQAYNSGYGYDMQSGQTGIAAQSGNLAAGALNEFVSNGVVAPEAVAGMYATDPGQVQAMTDYVSAYRNDRTGMHNPLTAFGMIYGGQDWDENSPRRGTNALPHVQNAPIGQALQAKFATQFFSRQERGTLGNISEAAIARLATEATGIRQSNPLYPEIQVQARRLGNFESYIDAFSRGEITSEQFQGLMGGSSDATVNKPGKPVAMATQEPEWPPDVPEGYDYDRTPSEGGGGMNRNAGGGNAGGGNGGGGNNGGGQPPRNPPPPNDDGPEDPWLSRGGPQQQGRPRQGNVSSADPNSYAELTKNLVSTMLNYNTHIGSLISSLERGGRGGRGPGQFWGSMQQKIFGTLYQEGATAFGATMAKMVNQQGEATGASFGEVIAAEEESGTPQYKSMGDREFSYMQKLDPFLKGTATNTQLRDLYKGTERMLKRRDLAPELHDTLTGVMGKLNDMGGPAAKAPGPDIAPSAALKDFSTAIDKARKSLTEFQEATKDSTKGIVDTKEGLTSHLKTLYRAQGEMRETLTNLNKDKEQAGSMLGRDAKADAGRVYSEIGSEIRRAKTASGLSEDEVAEADREAKSARGGGGGRGGARGSLTNMANRMLSGYFAFQAIRAVRYTFAPVEKAGEQYLADEASVVNQFGQTGTGVGMSELPGWAGRQQWQNSIRRFGMPANTITTGYSQMFGGAAGEAFGGSLGQLGAIGLPAIGAAGVTMAGLGMAGLGAAAPIAAGVIGGATLLGNMAAWSAGAAADTVGAGRYMSSLSPQQVAGGWNMNPFQQASRDSAGFAAFTAAANRMQVPTTFANGAQLKPGASLQDALQVGLSQIPSNRGGMSEIMNDAVRSRTANLANMTAGEIMAVPGLTDQDRQVQLDALTVRSFSQATPIADRKPGQPLFPNPFEMQQGGFRGLLMAQTAGDEKTYLGSLVQKYKMSPERVGSLYAQMASMGSDASITDKAFENVMRYEGEYGIAGDEQIQSAQALYSARGSGKDPFGFMGVLASNLTPQDRMRRTANLSSMGGAYTRQGLQRFGINDQQVFDRMETGNFTAPQSMALGQMFQQAGAGSPQALSLLGMAGMGPAASIGPMMDLSTGSGLFERSMWGLNGYGSPSSGQVSSFFSQGAQQLSGQQASAGTAIGFTPINSWARASQGSRDAIVNAAMGSTFGGVGGVAGLQMLGNQWQTETNNRLANAGAALAAQGARLQHDFTVNVAQPQEWAGLSMKRASLWGGGVDEQTKKYFEDNGIPLPDYGRGKFARERASIGLQAADQAAQASQTMTRLGWQLEDLDRGQVRAQIQTGWQRDDFGIQGARMGLQRGMQQYQFAFQANEMQIGRQQFREDYAYNRQMSNLQFGWQQEDMDEGIRRSTGYQRRQLIKQRDRSTTVHNLEEGQAEKEKDRQEDKFKRDEEYFKKQVQHQSQLNKLEDQEFANAKKRFEEQVKWRDEDYNTRRARIMQEMAWAAESHARAKASMDLRLEQLAVEESEAKTQQAMQEVRFAKEKELEEEKFKLSQIIVGMTKEEKNRMEALQQAILTMRQKEQDRVEELNRVQMKFYTDLLGLFKGLPNLGSLLGGKGYAPVTGGVFPPPPKTDAITIQSARTPRQNTGGKVLQPVNLVIDGKKVGEATLAYMPELMSTNSRRSYE